MNLTTDHLLLALAVFVIYKLSFTAGEVRGRKKEIDERGWHDD